MQNPKTILDLPFELLDSILCYGAGTAEAIFDFDDWLCVSRCCWRLRSHALPVLFAAITVTFPLRTQRRHHTMLDFLSSRPHICSFVQRLDLSWPGPGFEDQEAERKKFQTLLPLLPQLQHIKLFWYGSYGKAALATVLASKPGTKVSIISDHVWPDVAQRSRTYGHPDPQEPFSFFTENTTADIEAVVLYSHCASALNPLLVLSQKFSRLLCGLRSLGVSLRYQTFEGDETTNTLLDLHSQKLPLTKTSFPSLIELHFYYQFNHLEPVHPTTVAFLESIPWPQLKKLSLSDPRTPIWILPQVYKSMINLSALRMDALGPPAFMKSFQFKILQRIPTDWRYYLPWARDIDKITSYLAEHSLRELSLEGFDRALCSWNFNVPRLRTLKIHTTEAVKLKFDERSHVRTGAEMQKIAQSAPELEHLELDVPRLGKAYDPTAVPGIDFDIHLHGILDGITKLEKLKSLRLFPAFRNQDDREILHPNNFANPGEFRQDLTDDVVVRLFQRLREKRPTLQRLLISSDNCVVHFVKDFDPTSWDISALRNVITVVVRQADRDYEQRQIWVGERRIRTEIRHFTHHKRYLQEFEGWGIEC